MSRTPHPGGLDPSEPRFEKAVRYARSLFPGLRRDLADDLAQEVRIALWLHGGDGRHATVAYRTAMDWWRHLWGRGSRRAMGQLEIPVAAPEGASIAAGHLAPPNDGAERRALQRLLERNLGVRDAAILMMHVQGFSAGEIGECSGTTAGRVSQILIRAKTRLHHLYGASGEKKTQARRRAEAWLQEQLAAGPLPSATLYERAAKTKVCGRRTLYYAAKDLGVIMKRQGGVVTWRRKGA